MIARLAFTVAPIVLLVAVFAAALARRRPVLAAAVAATVAPSLLAEIAAGRRHGLVAALVVFAAVAAGPVARRYPAAAPSLGAVIALGALASFWAATPVRDGGVAPSWTSLTASIGSYVERAVGGLGELSMPAPTTAVLAWWTAVAILVGAVVVSDRPRVALVPGVAVILLVVLCMAIERWRGPVNPVGGAWLLAGAVAVVGARAELPRLASRRTLAGAAVLVAWAWVASSATDGTRSARGLAVGATALLALAVWRSTRTTGDPRGVNVVGYHSITGGLGERTRELTACFEAAGVPVARVDLDVDSERETAVLPPPQERYASTVVVAPAFEVEPVVRSHPELFGRRRLVAGYWFWELDRIPATHRGGLAAVDEVWAPTRFVRDAYAAAAAVPVRHVPLPIPEPEVAPLGRADLGLDDAIVFLVSFSHLSVMERKNPIDAITAFRDAFAADDPGAPRVRLIVKTLNADRRPDDAARLRAAAAGDARIEIRDRRLEHPELMALVAAADVFVSLHRSEGLGLQIADAMWLGTPVLATDYSGSRDLLEPGVAELVPWTPTAVRNGEGAYPDEDAWAQPDLAEAAAAMRRLATHPERRRRLAEAARKRMEAQPDRAAVGRSLAKLARCR